MIARSYVGYTSLLIFGTLVLVSCGKPKNSNMPPTPTDLRGLPPSTGSDNEAWTQIAAYMGFPIGGQNQSALEANLATPPSTAESFVTGNGKIIDDAIKTEVISTALQTQCGGLVSLSYVGPTTGAAGKVYTLSYKLRDAQGMPESAARSAIVTTPNVASGFPLAMYAHDLNIGASYAELAQSAAAAQGSNVFAMPTYPGEPLCTAKINLTNGTCSGTTIPAVGTRSLYLGDAKELLGLQSCMLAMAEIADPTGKFDFSTREAGDIATVNPFHNFAGNTHKILEGSTQKGINTIYFGSGRGGAVALLAAARAGIMISSYLNPQADKSEIKGIETQVKAVDPNFVFTPHYVSAIGLNAPHTSALMGLDRLKLEAAFKNQVTLTAFGSLPTWTEWQALVSGLATADAANAIAMRDVLYMGKYIAPALQNWKQFYAGNYSPAMASKGTLAIIHGTEDIIFPYTHSKVAFSVFQNTNVVFASLKSKARAAFVAGGLPSDDSALNAVLASSQGKATVVGALKASGYSDADIADALLVARLHGFAYQVYAFQPADSLYTKPCTSLTNALNSNCFASSSTVFDHGTEEFFASKLANHLTDEQKAAAEQTLPGVESVAVGLATLVFADPTKLVPARQAFLLSQALPANTYPADTKLPDSELFNGNYKESASLLDINPAQMMGVWLGSHVPAALQ